jgi:hypothetical protein
MRIEPQDPIPHDLKRDIAQPRRIRARAAVIDRGKRQETACLRGIPGLARQTPQTLCVEILS